MMRRPTGSVSGADAHISPLGMMRLAAESTADLAADPASAAAEHVARCPRCRSALELLREEQRAIAGAPLPDWLAPHAAIRIEGEQPDTVRDAARARDAAATADGAVSPIASPRHVSRSPATSRRRWLLPAGSALALAAGLVAIWSIRPGSTDEPPAVRRKGSGLHVFIAGPGGAVREGKDGDVVHPGDRLQLAYTDEGGFLAVLGLDGSGAATVYFPAAGAAAAIPAGVRVLLPYSIELDAAPGPERIVALFCRGAVPLEPLRVELAARRDLAAPPGCRIESMSLAKEAGDGPG
jgi:hypothetical protein